MNTSLPDRSANLARANRPGGNRCRRRLGRQGLPRCPGSPPRALHGNGALHASKRHRASMTRPPVRAPWNRPSSPFHDGGVRNNRRPCAKTRNSAAPRLPSSETPYTACFKRGRAWRSRDFPIQNGIGLTCPFGAESTWIGIEPQYPPPAHNSSFFGRARQRRRKSRDLAGQMRGKKIGTLPEQTICGNVRRVGLS